MMKQIKCLALAALVAFAACDEEGNLIDPVAQTGTVTATVTAGGAGLAGVTVSLAGPSAQSAVTSATGTVTFSAVPVGGYAVTISGVPPDFTCATTSTTVTVAAGATATAAFSCNIVQTASISVSVTRGTAALGGASVTITRTAPAPAGTPATLQTGPNGQVMFTGLRSGTYTVALTAPAGVTCTTTSQTVTLAVGLAQIVNFTCDPAPPPPTSSISGVVMRGSVGLADATVTITPTGGTALSLQTGANGQFSFNGLAAGTYSVVITPPAGVTCGTTTQSVVLVDSQAQVVNFTCDPAPPPIGTGIINVLVTRGAGLPVGSAAVTITRAGGAPQGPVLTGVDGRASFTALGAGVYTVVITPPAGVNCAATTQSVNVADGAATAVSFACDAPTGGGDPASVIITSITVGATIIPVNLNAVAGVVSVTMHVDEGDQNVTRLELLLGGEVVYSQNFSSLQASQGDAGLAEFDVTATINTAAFNPETGEPNLLNQTTQFEARIFTSASPTTPISSATVGPAILVNADFMSLRVGTSRAPLISVPGGLEWRSGDITIDAVPVVYSGNFGSDQQVSRLITSVTGFVPEAGLDLTVTNTQNRVNATTPFADVVFRADRSIQNAASTRGVGDIEDAGLVITIGALRLSGQGFPGTVIVALCDDGTVPLPFPPFCQSGQAPVPLRFDTNAPTVVNFDQALRVHPDYNPDPDNSDPDCEGLGADDPADQSLTDQVCNQERWVGLDKVFTVSTSTSGATLDRNVQAPDFGVGRTGDFFTFRAGMSTDDMDVVTAASALPATANNNRFFLNVEVRDLFGNARTMWYDGSETGVSLEDFDDDLDDLEAALIGDDGRFGNDKIRPELDLIPGSLRDGEIADVDGTNVVVEITDDHGSPASPILSIVQQQAPGVSIEDGCLVGEFDDGECLAAPGNGNFDVSAADEPAYYDVWYQAIDLGGNLSNPLNVLVIHDDGPPVVGGLSSPAAPVPGNNVTLQAPASDLLDLNEAMFFLEFTGEAAGGADDESYFQSESSLGTFGPPFTRNASASSTFTYIGQMQEGTAAGSYAGVRGVIRVSDFGASAPVEGIGAFFTDPTLQDFDDPGLPSDEEIFSGSEDMVSSRSTVCWDTNGNGCPTNANQSTDLSFMVSGAGNAGPDGPLGNIFERVTFYVALDADGNGIPDDAWIALGNGAVSVVPGAATFEYTYRLTRSGRQLGETAGLTTLTAAGTAVLVRAVGYTEDGRAFTVADFVLGDPAAPPGTVRRIQLRRD